MPLGGLSMKRSILLIPALIVLATAYIVLGGQDRCDGNPNITEVDPSSGVVNQRIVISGDGFGPSQEESSIVEFSGIPAEPSVYWSENEIYVDVPDGASSGPITVTVNGKRSNEFYFEVTEPIVLSEEEGEEIYDTQSNGSYYYQDLVDQGDPDAISHTAEWIASQPGVQSTYVLENGETIRIEYEVGIRGYIYTRNWNQPQAQDEEIRVVRAANTRDSLVAASKTSRLNKKESPGNKSAIFILPFQNTFQESSHNNFAAALQEAGFSVPEPVEDAAADIDFMMTIDEYGVIYIETHGFYDDIGRDQWIFIGQDVSSYLSQLWNGIDPAFQAGIAWGWVNEGGWVGRVMLDENFFRQLNYPNSFVIMHACYSLIREELANSFINNGAGVYFGWDNKTIGGISRKFFPYFLPALLKDQDETGQFPFFHPNRTVYEFYRQTEVHFPIPPQYHEIMNHMMPMNIYKEDENDDWKFCWYPYEPEEDKCMGEGTSNQVDWDVSFDYRGDDNYILFPNQAPSAPANPTPTNGAEDFSPNRPTFTWDPSTDPDGDIVQYCVAIQEHPDFGGEIIYDGCDLQDYLDNPSFTLNEDLESYTTYEWGVWAKDPCGYWSDAINPRWGFTTGEALQYSLPDTGITLCYDDTQEIECPAPGESFYGQDAQYITNPMSFTDNGDGTITDNVTGLMWQQEDDDMARDWENALSYCENLILPDGGHDDWRLPNEDELQSIVDYGRFDSAIDEDLFPGTNASYYWSSSTHRWTYLAWSVNYLNGYIDSDYKTTDYHVRCVRGDTVERSFTDNGDGTVTDNVTGLMWQQEDDDTTRDWEGALAYCENLTLPEGGYADWRLPDIKELRSIVDNTQYQPAIDWILFPETKTFTYRSSSTYTVLASYGWYVWFFDGAVRNTKKENGGYVRCVR